MRPAVLLLSFVLFAGAPVSFLKYQRPVHLSTTAAQHYVIVDETVWKHARPDLSDLRLYAGQTEIPYALAIERGSQQHERTPVTVMQQSTIAGKTQFLLDMSGLPEYDRVDLTLSTKNFVAHAHAEGQDDPHASQWANLGDSTLYDLSKENLGSNHVVRVPRSTYKYLRITLDGPVKPEDIQGAFSEMKEEHPARWRALSSAPRQEQNGKDTVFTFEVADRVPVERISFSVDPTQPNFLRNIEIHTDNDRWLASGEINRIHLVREGQKIDSDIHDVNFTDSGQAADHRAIKVIVHNGDDPPLKLTGAVLQQMERRLYFDDPGTAELKLYYGDEKLEAPLYDYVRLFRRDNAASAAELAPEEANPFFTARPDARPWSERHPVVLWIAIIAAVLVLGALALRSMRTAAA